MQLPEEFLREMKELLGGEYEDWLKSFEETKGFRGLRINRLKAEPADFSEQAPFSLRPVPWTENGYYIEGEERASRHPWYAAGRYYLQEPSAMTPAACLPVEEGDRVLDLCAAPGGKATELAAKLQGTGILVANDISNSRAKGLLKNLELFGAGNILVTSETPERLCLYFEGWFDKILVDAPCSGEGMFRKEPAMVRDWQEKGPSFYAPIQKEILLQAARLLRPGGLLLYSTCTFSVRENEESVLTLLRREPGFEVLPLPVPGDELGFAPGRPDLVKEPLSTEEHEGLRRAVRLYPHRLSGEGHFTALLRKKENKEGALKEEHQSLAGKERSFGEPKTLPSEWEEFSKGFRFPGKAKDNEREKLFHRERLRLYEGRLYALPEALTARNIRGLRFLRTGLYLGEVLKKRFEPSPALAMYLRKDEWGLCVDLDGEDERVIRYLKGETLDVEDLTEDRAKGWCLVCVDGSPLGWGKLSNGSLKNKYYPGWRWQ